MWLQLWSYAWLKASHATPVHNFHASQSSSAQNEIDFLPASFFVASAGIPIVIRG